MSTITTPKGAGHHEFSDAAAGRDQAWKPDKIKAWVMSHIAIGERFKAPIDSYSSVRVFGYSDRMVVGFYQHYVLTVDDYDHTETYQYYDMMELLRREGR